MNNDAFLRLAAYIKASQVGLAPLPAQKNYDDWFTPEADLIKEIGQKREDKAEAINQQIAITNRLAEAYATALDFFKKNNLDHSYTYQNGKLVLLAPKELLDRYDAMREDLAAMKQELKEAEAKEIRSIAEEKRLSNELSEPALLELFNKDFLPISPPKLSPSKLVPSDIP